MQTENDVRGIGVLLALDTYQGMSDDEIESIITYKTNMAYRKGNNDALSSQSMMNVMENKKRMDSLFDRVANMINYDKGGSADE